VVVLCLLDLICVFCSIVRSQCLKQNKPCSCTSFIDCTFTQVLILVGANVQSAGDITPKEGDFNSTYRVTQPSIVLRWGIQVGWGRVLVSFYSLN
jgi:hypothetical protein